VNFQAPRQKSQLNNYIKERILDMWANNKTAHEICEALGLDDAVSVSGCVQRARKLGDARAAYRPAESRFRKKGSRIVRHEDKWREPPPKPDRVAPPMEGVPLRCAEFGIEKVERLVPKTGQCAIVTEPFDRISLPRVRFLEGQ
jgi:hypothetical protein